MQKHEATGHLESTVRAPRAALQRVESGWARRLNVSFCNVPHQPELPFHRFHDSYASVPGLLIPLACRLSLQVSASSSSSGRRAFPLELLSMDEVVAL